MVFSENKNQTSPKVPFVFIGLGDASGIGFV